MEIRSKDGPPKGLKGNGFKIFILFCFLVILVLDLSWKPDLLAFIDRTCLILVIVILV
jgi:hypothetical protein